MDGAPANGAVTITILARLFIESDAVRAPSTPSREWLIQQEVAARQAMRLDRSERP
jgi:hypothetical protein